METTDSELHCQEVAAFASVFLGRAPGVVWPEHDHPACDPLAAEADRELLALGLAGLLGRAVQTVPSERAPLSVRAARAPCDTLVHQTSGSGLWTLLPGPGEDLQALPTENAVHFQLRSTEVLYIPPNYSWIIQPVVQPSTYLFTFIGDRQQVAERTTQ
ncbi:hypothetical protein [Streptomyces sp. MI02-7b]|uniref:hypothetical protein n=1 Tax=Streptomyces sp. MI02-7b TaxID=462941 RepID=UPI0029B2223D|nr:hypothetical protein [Streptomyces sp. MI02-7b]MDX3076292.1 hypothetical protein [Streptomyces sp. MI02-7b]